MRVYGLAYGALLATLDVGGRDTRRLSTPVNVAIPALERRGVFVGHADDHGNDPNAGTALALGGAASASIYPAGDQDVFRLRIDVAAEVAIYTTGDVDTAGVLRDAEGRWLTANDNTGGRTNFMIAHRLDSGDYDLHVRGADESTRGPYIVEAHEDPNAAVLPDLNLRAAVADSLSKAPHAAITPVDLAAMTSLSAAGHGIGNLSGLESAANLTHVDLDRNRIVDAAPLAHLTALEELRLVGNAVEDVDPLVANAGLGDGDRVFLQGNPLSTTAVNEQIPALAGRGVAVVFADDHANRASAATTLALGGSSPGTIHRELDRDYFRFTVPGTTTDVAVFTTGGVDLVGTLTSRRGAQLATDDDSGAGTNFFLRAALAPGDYYIEVEGYADSLGAYVVHAVAEEAVRIPDDGLLTRVEYATGAAARSPLTTASLASLDALDASITRISNVAGLEAAVNLRHLALRHNRIEDVQPLSALTRLVELDLQGNRVADIAALADNAGLGQGDKVVLAGNPLGRTALDVQLPALAERGVFVGRLDDHGDARQNATALDPGGRAAGTLSTVDDEDVFRVVLSAAAAVAFHTTGPTDTVGSLSAAGAALRVTDHDGGVGGNFAIRRRLGAGAHYLTVSGSGRGLAGVGPYVLHATVAPTAPPANITVLRDGPSLVVTWDPVLADLASGTITRYRVVAMPSDGGAPLGCTAGPNADGCTIVGLADGVDYTVTVNAVNAVGYGPVGTVAPPDPMSADVPLTSFWRGWRLSLAEPPENGNVSD